MASFRNVVATGWVAEKDAAKVYPAVDKASVGASDYI